MQTIIVCAVAFFLAQFTYSSHQSSARQCRAIDLGPFRLPSRAVYTSGSEVAANDSFLASTKQASYLESATQLVNNIVPNATYRIIGDHYLGDNGIAHVNFRQTIYGIDIDNADFNVNIRKDGSVLSYGNSFYTGQISKLDSTRIKRVVSPVAALKGVSTKFNLPITVNDISTEDTEDTYISKGTLGTVSNPKARLVYFYRGDGSVTLTWRVETDLNSNWLLTYVDASNSDNILGVVDYVAQASYEVYKWGVNCPNDGPRTLVSNPWDAKASPFTWTSDGTTHYNTTRGNNCIAQYNPSDDDSYLSQYRPESSEQQFTYPYSPSMSPPTEYINASVVQLFYTANKYHDLLYILGFNEKAGNFQWNNSGRSGKENDYVILNAQDGFGSNNADFATPPDGQPGRMNMYLWTDSTPYRDGSFQSDLIIHEYTHGLSNRLTGGPSNTACLTSLESAGMGEGWGDFMAISVLLKPNDTRSGDYRMFEWASNIKGGCRAYPYSTSLVTNPLIYVNVNSLQALHEIGAVWASMLYEVLWNLIDKHGINGDHKPSFRNNIPTDGRYLTMKLVMDGMALQPCNPNFIQARDAILDADTVLTNGTNHCDIWKGFAKRGLGHGAKYSATVRSGSTALPPGIC